jgi:hypothetical protein
MMMHQVVSYLRDHRAQTTEVATGSFHITDDDVV